MAFFRLDKLGRWACLLLWAGPVSLVTALCVAFLWVALFSSRDLLWAWLVFEDEGVLLGGVTVTTLPLSPSSITWLCLCNSCHPVVAVGDGVAPSAVSCILTSLTLLVGEGGACTDSFSRTGSPGMEFPGMGNWDWSMESERVWGDRRWCVEGAGEAADSGLSMRVLRLEVLSSHWEGAGCAICGSDGLI